ncbi:hypothetical protein D7I39_06735 [Allopusillimonas ginsengisoli]|nr:hypothetical protein D7I39_06735 [Allopusillimonas ginsengisoli]
MRAHNYSSGLAEASQADIALTKHVKRAPALVDVRLVCNLSWPMRSCAVVACLENLGASAF